MSFILGLVEASWIGIGLLILPFLVGAFLRNKAKADRSDIMVDVVKIIDKKMIPLEKRLEKHDDDINKIITKQEVIHTKVVNILTGQSEHKEDFKTRMTSLETLIGKFFDQLDKKKDK